MAPARSVIYNPLKGNPRFLLAHGKPPQITDNPPTG